jgi:hypothetical protein
VPRSAQSPPPGIVREATAEATPGRWFDCNNVRWRGGVLVPVGGNMLLQGSNVANVPRDIITWHDNSYKRWAAYGTDVALWAYCFDTGVQYNITPTGAPPILPPGYPSGYGLGNYGDGIYGISSPTGSPIGPPGILGTLTDWWSMDTFGQLLLVVPTQDGHLYSWDPTAPTTPATQVLNAPTKNRGVIVTDQRQVVLYGSGGDPRNIAWSDTEDMTKWTPDVTNLAGSKELVTQAAALTACKVAAGILLFTTNDVHMMQYVGPPFAYGITQIGAGCGPISPRAVAGAGSFVAWMSSQNFWLYNGTVQVLGCDVKNWFFSNLKAGSEGRLFGSANPKFAELWWDWPDGNSTSGENNRYIAMNYSGALPGVYSGGGAGYSAGYWLLGSRARTGGDRIGTLDYPVLGAIGPGGTGGALYQHETGYTDNGTPRASAGEVYAESGAIVQGEGDIRFHVKQLVFDSTTDPTLSPPFGFRFFAKEQPFDTVETDSGLYTQIHGGLMDTRLSGRSIRMRLEATADAPFSVGKTRIDVAPAGRR